MWKYVLVILPPTDWPFSYICRCTHVYLCTNHPLRIFLSPESNFCYTFECKWRLSLESRFVNVHSFPNNSWNLFFDSEQSMKQNKFRRYNLGGCVAEIIYWVFVIHQTGFVKWHSRKQFLLPTDEPSSYTCPCVHVYLTTIHSICCCYQNLTFVILSNANHN